MSESKISIERLEQIVTEVEKFWRLYQLGIFTFSETIAEVNARRVELGFEPLTETQVQQAKLSLERRGIL